MYDDYQRQKQIYDGVDIPHFLTGQNKPVPRQIQPYGKARLMNQKRVIQNKKQTPQRQPRKGNRQHVANMKKQFNNFNNQGKTLHGGSSGILKNMENLIIPILLIATAAMGLKTFLGNLKTSDLERNVYGGGGVSPSGRSTGQISKEGLEYIKKKEGGFHPKAYKVPGETMWTIGYGDHGPHVKEGDVITEPEAEQRLMKKVHAAENDVNNRIKVPLSQNMFDALVSLAYNMGSLAPAETLVKKLNAGDYKGAAEAFKLYDKGKESGKVVTYAGLTKRRAEEAERFLKDVDLSTNKLKSTVTEINPQLQASSEPVDIKDIGKAQEINGNGIRYDKNANITSHTKVKGGANDFYNESQGEMGTWNGVKINSGIGKRSVAKGSSWHKGLDLDYPNGTPVKAFCSGTCTYAAVMAGFGRLVIVDDKKGYRHIYGHLSKFNISKGNPVKKGQIIGYSGGSGTQNGKLIDGYFAPHLHYGIWQPSGKSDSDYIDPRTYKFPPEDDGVPKTETPKVETPKGNPITPKTQKPTTTNPKTQPTQKPQTQTKKPQITNTNVKAKPANTNNSKTVDLDKPGIKNRAIKQSNKK